MSQVLSNLDLLRSRFTYADVNEDLWDRAAEFWAIVRQQGLPTAGIADLDADSILAGIAATMGEPGDPVVIATMSLRHFGRFPGISAQFRQAIP